MEAKVLSWIRASGKARGGRDKEKHIAIKVHDNKGSSTRRDGTKREPKYKVKVNRLTMSHLPNHESPKSDLRNIIGVVVPQGHGKTKLSEEEGWVDFDSLVSSRLLDELREGVYEEVQAGRSIELASTALAEEGLKSLRIMNPDYPTILMCNTFSLLEAMGVECVGAVAVKPDVILKYNQHRAQHERLMIEKNIEEVVMMGGSRVAVMDDIDDVRWYIYNICQHSGIPIARPDLYDMTEETIRDLKYYGSFPPLSEVVNDYYAGVIPREVVDYHVKHQGLRSYQGFGFTQNDWARVAGYASLARGSTQYDDRDWVDWPLSLSLLSETIDLSEHDDIKFIIDSHKGEHERFVLALIFHWKMLGSTCGIAKSILPLYGVRRVHWVSCLTKIRDGVLASNTLFGKQLTMDERSLIISMRLLAAGSFAQLGRLLESEQGAFPRSSPNKELIGNASTSLDSVIYAPSDMEKKNKLLARIIQQSHISEIRNKDWSGSLARLESIALGVGRELASHWEGEQDCGKRVSMIMKGIIHRWHKACMIRDEWSDMCNQLLEEKAGSNSLGDAIGAMVSCDIISGSSGTDWSLRIMEAFKGFVVCGIVSRGKGRVLMQQSEHGLRPCVLGMSEGEIWAKAFKLSIPRNALGCFSKGLSEIQMLNELCGWSSNKTVMILEMINTKSWLPSIGDRTLLALLCRWQGYFDQGDSAYLFSKIADRYCKSILGRSYLRVKDRLGVLMSICCTDGGLGCGEVSYHGKMSTRRDGQIGRAHV